MTRGRKAARTIVVATDFSKLARRAYDHAVELAGALRAKLCVVHVIKGAWAADECEPGSRPLKSLKTTALLQLGRLARLASEAGIAVDVRLEVGDPTERVLETCRKQRAELLVVGTQGRGGMTRALLGSVADALVRSAPCPVLTLNRSVDRRRPSRS